MFNHSGRTGTGSPIGGDTWITARPGLVGREHCEKLHRTWPCSPHVLAGLHDLVANAFQKIKDVFGSDLVLGDVD
jgi:hypothetical protein